MIYQGALYLLLMPKGETEDLLLFVVPRAHQVTALNGCHRDVGHQGHDGTLSLLKECFWWPGMISKMQQSIKSCEWCLKHKGNISKVPLHPIVATAPLDLLHIDFTSMEMTMELNQLPRVANVLVFQDHFTQHVMAYVTPNLMAKTVVKLLYQGYISIFGPQPSSWVIGVPNLWAVSSKKCVCSLVWRNCGPCYTTHRLMGWWRDHIRS